MHRYSGGTAYDIRGKVRVLCAYYIIESNPMALKLNVKARRKHSISTVYDKFQVINGFIKYCPYVN